MTRRRPRALSCVAIGLALVLAACQGSDEPLPDPPAPLDLTSIGEYVALGDSYTSGPSISPEQRRSGICLRSELNYPQLLAKDLGVDEVKDVSCAGATTDHVLSGARGLAPKAPGAQVDELSRDTDLVTVGIGYNDDGIFGRIFGSCLPSPDVKPATCQEFVDGQVPELLKSERIAVVEVLDAVRRASPDATVVLMGYLPLLPEPDTCPASVIPSANQQSAHDAEAAIDDNLRAAADEVGVQFVSMRAAAAGHGVCAGEDAWVNGAEAAPGDGEIFHPRASGMVAVADELASFLREQAG